ncbi:hypothetical protein [Paenibacillus dokdonensis]
MTDTTASSNLIPTGVWIGKVAGSASDAGHLPFSWYYGIESEGGGGFA